MRGLKPASFYYKKRSELHLWSRAGASWCWWKLKEAHYLMSLGRYPWISGTRPTSYYRLGGYLLAEMPIQFHWSVLFSLSNWRRWGYCRDRDGRSRRRNCWKIDEGVAKSPKRRRRLRSSMLEMVISDHFSPKVPCCAKQCSRGIYYNSLTTKRSSLRRR